MDKHQGYHYERAFALNWNSMQSVRLPDAPGPPAPRTDPCRPPPARVVSRTGRARRPCLHPYLLCRALARPRTDAPTARRAPAPPDRVEPASPSKPCAPGLARSTPCPALCRAALTTENAPRGLSEAPPRRRVRPHLARPRSASRRCTTLGGPKSGGRFMRQGGRRRLRLAHRRDPRVNCTTWGRSEALTGHLISTARGP